MNYVYFHQLSVGQAAALENCSVNTIKSRLFYARPPLRRAIEEEERRTGDKLYLPPVVLGIAALMALPGIPLTLSAAESAKIFTTVLGALSIGQTINPESVSFIAVPEEDEETPKRNKLRSVLQRKYLLKFSPAAIIPFVLIILVLMTAMLGIGYLQHKDPPPADTNDPVADAQTTETTTEASPVPAEVSPFTYSVGADGIMLEKIITDKPSLEEHALAGIPELLSVRLSDHIQTLPAAVLADNPKITEYFLPILLKEFDATAFSGCPALERLIFCGPYPAMVGEAKLVLTREDTVLFYPASQESRRDAEKFGVINTGTYTWANQNTAP